MLVSLAGERIEGPPFSAFDRGAGFGMYGTCKAALGRLAQSFAAELYEDGIAVNAASTTKPVATPGAGALDLAKDDTEDIGYITETAFHLCTGDPAVLTGRVVETQPFLRGARSPRLGNASTIHSMQPLRRVHTVGAVSVAIVIVALVALVAPIARAPTLERRGSSPPASSTSIVDAATELVESAAIDTASGRSWHRSREPALGLGIVAALCAAVAAAALCFLLRSARDRVQLPRGHGQRDASAPSLHALS